MAKKLIKNGRGDAGQTDDFEMAIEQLDDGRYAEVVVSKNSVDRTLIDNNADGNQYIGTAVQGSAVGDAVWAITKNDNGSPVKDFTHSASGQIWNNRATSVTYS